MRGVTKHARQPNGTVGHGGTQRPKEVPLALRRRAAVDHEDLPGHKRRLVRGQVERREADLLGLADAADRLRRLHLTAVPFILPEIGAEVRLD